MNFKTTYYLFGAFLLVMALLIFSGIQGPKVGNDNDVLDAVQAKVEAKDITKVEINRTKPKEEKLVFQRDAKAGDRWVMVEPIKTRVDNFVVDSLIRQMIQLRKDENASADLPRDLAADGLAPPASVVTMTAADGKSWTLNLGGESIGSEDKRFLYVTSGAKPNDPVAVKRAELDNAFKLVKDIRDRNLVIESNLNTLGVGLKDAKNELHVSKVGDPNQWWFDNPKYGEADYEGDGSAGIQPNMPIMKVNGIRDLLVAIEQMRVTATPDVDDFVANSVPEAELEAKYGLGAKPATIRIEAKARPAGLRPGDTLGGDKEKEPVTAALLIGNKADEKGEKYYARMENENNVVKIGARNVDSVVEALANPTVLRNKDLLQTEDANIAAIEIKSSTGTIKLQKEDPTKAGPGGWLLMDTPEGQKADKGSVDLLARSLNTRRQVNGFPTKTDKEMGLDDADNPIVVKVWEMAAKKDDKPEEKKPDEKPDEKKKPSEFKPDKEPVTLVFGKKEGENVYVRRERMVKHKEPGKGEVEEREVTRVTVPAGLLDRVTPGKIAFLDRTLPSIPREADITKVTIKNAKGTFELDKEKSDGKFVWKIKQPKDQEGRIANQRTVDQIIETVRSPYTDKLVTTKATDGELDKYGLNPGNIQVKLTIKKDEKTNEEKTFLFGNNNEANDGRYAKQGDRDLVYLVRPNVIDTLQGGDFVDLQVLSYDPAKVNQLKITGWQDAEKKPVTLDLEFKSPKEGEPKVWTIKNADENKDIQIDGTKVSQFVAELSRLYADKYLVFKTGPKPEYKLDEKERALQIEIYVEGDEKDKSPRTLTIGALLTEGDKKDYAVQSNSLPGDVVAIPEARFEKLLKEGRKYFAKAP